MNHPRPHLRPLTSLRFFAALLVLASHAFFDILTRLPPLIAGLVSNGYSAVSFFFVLSGFVLTYVYGDDELPKPLPSGNCGFWKARFARIYPAYFLALLIALPAFIYSVSQSKLITWHDFYTGIVLVPAFLQAWWPPTAVIWNIPAWSLSVEAFFYLLFPFLLRPIVRTNPATLFVVMVLTIILVSAARLWLLSSTAFNLSPVARFNFASYFPLLFLPHFVIGMALSRCFTAKTGVLSRILDTSAFPAAIIIALLFLLHHRVPVWIFSDAVLVPMYCAVIYGVAKSKGRFAAILSNNILVSLGESSYALYILHVPLAFWFQWISLRYGWSPFDSWLGIVAFSTFSITTTYAVFAYFERPVRRWMLNRHIA